MTEVRQTKDKHNLKICRVTPNAYSSFIKEIQKEGSIYLDLSNKRLIVGNGELAGGISFPNYTEFNRLVKRVDTLQQVDGLQMLDQPTADTYYLKLDGSNVSDLSKSAITKLSNLLSIDTSALAKLQQQVDGLDEVVNSSKTTNAITLCTQLLDGSILETTVETVRSSLKLDEATLTNFITNTVGGSDLASRLTAVEDKLNSFVSAEELEV